jgi:hypothetical protein
MEADGLITHTAAGGRKTYDITDAGRAELADRAHELNQLEAEIHESVADLAALAEGIEEGVRGSVRDLKRELRQAKQEARMSVGRRTWQATFAGGDRARAIELSEPAAEVARKAGELGEEVTRLVGLGRASTEDLRVASTVLDSVRDQLRHILRG